jgi:hypothetical protein
MFVIAFLGGLELTARPTTSVIIYPAQTTVSASVDMMTSFACVMMASQVKRATFSRTVNRTPALVLVCALNKEMVTCVNARLDYLEVCASTLIIVLIILVEYMENVCPKITHHDVCVIMGGQEPTARMWIIVVLVHAKVTEIVLIHQLISFVCVNVDG